MPVIPGLAHQIDRTRHQNDRVRLRRPQRMAQGEADIPEQTAQAVPFAARQALGQVAGAAGRLAKHIGFRQHKVSVQPAENGQNAGRILGGQHPGDDQEPATRPALLQRIDQGLRLGHIVGTVEDDVRPGLDVLQAAGHGPSRQGPGRGSLRQVQSGRGLQQVRRGHRHRGIGRLEGSQTGHRQVAMRCKGTFHRQGQPVALCTGVPAEGPIPG